MSDMPKLVQRGSTFYVSWYDPVERATKRESLRTKDPGEARRAYASVLLGDVVGNREIVGINVVDMLDAYVREHVNVKVVDKVRQQDACIALKRFFGTKPVRDIDIPLCREYGAHRQKEGVTLSTVRRELGALKAAASHAIKWKRLSLADAPSIESPPESSPKVEWLTKQEVAALLAGGEGKVRDFSVLAYWTGARRRSISRLHISQVDLQRSRIALALEGEAKTKKRRPVVPIFPEMRSTVERLVRETRTGYLFGAPTWDAYPPFVRLCEDVGIPEKKSNPHVLRHSRITHLLMDGVPPYDVARLVGDTVATIERVYGHHCPDYLASTVARKDTGLSEMYGK